MRRSSGCLCGWYVGRTRPTLTAQVGSARWGGVTGLGCVLQDRGVCYRTGVCVTGLGCVLQDWGVYYRTVVCVTGLGCVGVTGLGCVLLQDWGGVTGLGCVLAHPVPHSRPQPLSSLRFLICIPCMHYLYGNSVGGLRPGPHRDVVLLLPYLLTCIICSPEKGSPHPSITCGI